MNDVQVARALGVFSVGLGLAELAAPGWLGRKTGVQIGPNLGRLVGAREIASGVGVLAAPNPGPALWSRVFGDVVDLSLLAREWRHSPKPKRVLLALGAMGVVTMLDFVFARRLQRSA